MSADNAAGTEPRDLVWSGEAPPLRYPAIHFVDPDGTHRQGVLLRRYPDGARVGVQRETPSSSPESGIGFMLDFWLGVPEDQEAKAPGTWHYPEEGQWEGSRRVDLYAAGRSLVDVCEQNTEGP